MEQLKVAGRPVRRGSVRRIVFCVLVTSTSLYVTSGLIHHRTAQGRLACPVCQIMAHGSTVVPKAVPRFTGPMLYRLDGPVFPPSSPFLPSALPLKPQSRAPPPLA
jgi:hypothetical protein